VAPSILGSRPVGEAARVAEGVYQLKVPVPFPLRFVSVYLVRCEDGWTLVDAGYDYPPTQEVWGAGAAAVGCDLGADVARIIVTHFHPDHLGAARWLQGRTGAPVFMLGDEIAFSERVWGGSGSTDMFAGYLVRHGMPRGVAWTAAAEMRAGVALPGEMSPLFPGGKVPCGPRATRVLHAPGHADHQLALHDEGRGILFAADHVLLAVTPNIGLWPETEPRPLARYLTSLETMRGLDVDLVLPGRGPVLHDLDGRVDELTAHHAERLDAMLAVLDAGPKTPYEVSRAAFRGALTVHQRCFALAEALAHLDHLVLDGRATAAEGEAVSYEAA
jgi:glyoxylase-like metal-dependent hydrolase (beta-lactamase superfamily II)